jgi:hypothetical protein
LRDDFFFLNDVGLDLPLLTFDIDGLELFIAILVENFWLLREHSVGVLADANFASNTLLLNPLRHHYSRAKDVVPYDFCTNDASNDGAGMDTSSQI